MSSFLSSYINNSDGNQPYHDTPISSSGSSSSSSSLSTSSSCSSPDIQQKEYVLLNDRSRRKKRSFIPDDKKGPIYWSQRSKNNLSAKRSRVKRRMNDLVLETKLTQLSNENQILRAKIDMLTRKFGHLANKDELKLNQSNTDELHSAEVLNLLEQATSLKSDPTEEQTLIDQTETTSTTQSPMPMKWRFKLFNMTSNS